jgi:RimJ/RimL family protein N-acetyltransferase
MKTIIETDRLYLRELTMEDAPELAKVLSDPESMIYYDAPLNQEKVKKWIGWNLENYQKYKHGLWAVVLKDGDRFIGDCGITMQEIDNETVPEIGFHILKECWGQGYATEAAMACKKYAFDVLNYPSVYSYTTLEHKASQKIVEKIGMREYKFFEKNGKKLIAQVINKRAKSK